MGAAGVYGRIGRYVGMDTGDAQVGGGPRGRGRLILVLGRGRGQDSDYRHRGKVYVVVLQWVYKNKRWCLSL